MILSFCNYVPINVKPEGGESGSWDFDQEVFPQGRDFDLT